MMEPILGAEMYGRVAEHRTSISLYFYKSKGQRPFYIFCPKYYLLNFVVLNI